MTWELAEGLVNEIKNYLDNNISSKLEQLDVEFGDFVLDTPADIRTNEIILDNINAWPMVFVLVDNGSFEYGSHIVMQSAFTLTISVMVLEPNSELLRQKLYRYIRAILECIMEAHKTDSITWSPYFDGNSSVQYSPVYTSGQQYLADGALRLVMWKREET